MAGTASVFQTGAMPSSDLWRSGKRFCVLDTSLGDASDFIALRKAWTAAPGESRMLHYVALCGESLHPPAQAFENVWPLPLEGHHQISLGNESNVQLTAVFGEAGAALHRLASTFDLILLKPGIVVASDLARVARPGTTLQLKHEDEVWLDALQRSGFILERSTTGITGRFRGKQVRTSHGPPHEGERSAIIIGAGLAGTAAASSLAKRGWNITLIERHPVPANEASGNLCAAISPMLSKDDGIAARLSRASFFSLLTELRQTENSPNPAKWSPCGLLQMARDEKESSLQKEILAQRSYPPDYVRFLDKDAASQQVGWPVPAGGFYFPQGGWMNPASLCRSRLQSPNIEVRLKTEIARIAFENGLWRAVGQHETKICEAPVMILANAFSATQFKQASRLHFKKVRGQVTHIPAQYLPSLQSVISRDGYATPSYGGVSSVGATFDFDSCEPALSTESQQKNLARISLLLNDVTIPSLELSGKVGFRSLTADRLPVVGQIPDFESVTEAERAKGNIPRMSGLYALLGLGSRGAVWSTLAGEILAAIIDGEPPPISGDLLSAIDPARFLKRAKVPEKQPSTNA